jgi:hypothetical protein
MACDVCRRFPARTSQFEEIDLSLSRHGTLYRCKACDAFFELIAEERSVRFTPIEELRKYYPALNPGGTAGEAGVRGGRGQP